MAALNGNSNSGYGANNAMESGAEYLRARRDSGGSAGSAGRRMSEKDFERMMRVASSRSLSLSSLGMPPDNLCAKIAFSWWFENLTLAVIMFNAVWIWIDVDHNPSETLYSSPLVFIVVEYFFLVFFLVELLIRLGSYRMMRYCLWDTWFIFDASLVVLMLFDVIVIPLVVLIMSGEGQSFNVGDASVLRLARLLRLTRMARLMRAIPELMVLIRGIGSATRSVFSTLLLLTCIIYIFSLVFVQLLVETPLGGEQCVSDEYEFCNMFKKVPEAMLALLVTGVFPDQGPLLYAMGDVAWYYGVIFMAFCILATLTVTNMLVGILCEVAYRVAATEKDKMNQDFVKFVLGSIVNETIDTDGDQLISKKEFLGILHNDLALRAMHQVNVDIHSLIDNADFIFSAMDDEGNSYDRQLTFEEFMTVVTDLRANNFATVKDITNLRKFIKECSDKGDFLRSSKSGISSLSRSRTGSPQLRTGNSTPGVQREQRSGSRVGIKREDSRRARSRSPPRTPGRENSRPMVDSYGDNNVGEGYVNFDRMGGMPIELEELKQRLNRLEDLCEMAMQGQQETVAMYGKKLTPSKWSGKAGDYKELRRDLRTVPCCDPITDVLHSGGCMEMRMGDNRHYVSSYV